MLLFCRFGASLDSVENLRFFLLGNSRQFHGVVRGHSHRRSLFHHHHTGVLYSHPPHQTSETISPSVGDIGAGQDTLVEPAEIKVLIVQRRLVGLRCAPRQLARSTELPNGRGLRQIVGRHERPIVHLDLVKTLIVEHRHQRRISRCPVGIHHLQAPFLLLSGGQAVAERLPRQPQLLVGHRAFDGLLMTIAHTILHPRIAQQQTVAVFLLIFQFPVQQFTALLHHPTLNDLVAGINAIDDMEVGVAGTNLQRHGCAVVGELALRHIEPVVRRRGGFGVVESEDYKGHVHTVVATRRFQAMLAALQFPRCRRLSLISGALLPLTTVNTVFHLSFYLLSGSIPA